MITEKFDPKKQHNYAKAKVTGNWYDVSHFAKIDGYWKVWIGLFGFLELEMIQEWEVAED